MSEHYSIPENVSLGNQPKTRRGKKTLDKILAAAEEVFGEKGYYEASVTEIAQRAGIATGTFYLYFEEKKEVFRQLIYYLNHCLRVEIRKQIEGITDRRQVEITGITYFFTFILKHRNLYSLLREAESVDPELFRWYYSSFADSYVKGLQKGIDKGEIKPLDPETLAYCLMGISVFLGMRWALWENKVPDQEVIDSIKQFVLDGLKL